MQVLDGKLLASNLLEEIKEEIDKNKLNLGLAIISVGNSKENEIFVRNKVRTAEKLGVKVLHYNFSLDVEEVTILKMIDELNKNSSIQGIIVQLPLPSHLNTEKVMNSISEFKDIDGQNYSNLGRLVYGSEILMPCAASAVMTMLDSYKIDLEDKLVVVLGRSTLVGKPLANMLIKRNANVLVLHSKSTNCEDFLKKADVVIIAIHKANYLKGEMIKDGAIVIDVGTNVIDGKLVGDVDSSVACVASKISLVPGGIGVLTVAWIFKNLLTCYRLNCGDNCDN